MTSSPVTEDFEHFVARLLQPGRSHEPLGQFFDGCAEVVVARAPARLDVLGGIADYSGSLVLEQPLREAALVAVGRTDDDDVRVLSTSAGRWREVALPATVLWQASEDYDAARRFFGALGAESWSGYVAGALSALCGELGVRASCGLRLLVMSDVPEGKGVSSSAAVEVASLRALCALFRVAVDGPTLALACQRIENRVVGAPCGVMDQMTSACGKAERLLALLCQPAAIVGQLRVPDELAFFGIDSGLRHAVSGADYGDVRTAAFMGLRIVAEHLGARAVPIEPGRVLLEEDRLSGYLANLAPAELTDRLLSLLPERMTGADFLERYAGTTDPETQVKAGVTYPLRAATVHPVHENARVRAFAAQVTSARSERELTELGELMYRAHASYSACGLGSGGTDRLVELVREVGVAGGLYGAKITGGGSGGTVVVLSRRDAEASVRAVASRYASHTGHAAHVFAGSSPGAMECEPLFLEAASLRPR